MAVASLSILVLQGFIWKQSIAEEQRRFDSTVEGAVARLTHELMVEDRFSNVLVQAVNSSKKIVTSDSISGIFSTRSVFAIADTMMIRDSDKIDWTSLINSGKNGVTIRIQSDCAACEETRDLEPIERIGPILKERLAIDGVTADFTWGVFNPDNNEWIEKHDDGNLSLSSARSFPLLSFDRNQELKATPTLLSIRFPDEKWFLLRKLGTSLILSGLLAFGVLGCLAYALRTIVRQKQLSEIKTDFINNMTHELKTPIATISLASEALSDNSVVFPEEKKAEYLSMISTEADRLSSQVEKVLQMSLLDQSDFGLKLEIVNIHDLIRDIHDSFGLRMSSRRGRVVLDLNADKHLVQGDKMHLRQMLSNLLDNADKYSPDKPDLRVTTSDKEDGIEIEVIDKGLGIGRDKLKRIFERFYRVPSGNVHDVKGFGLGLSYVMSMARAHKGQVTASSKLGKGSSFRIFLPYSHE